MCHKFLSNTQHGFRPNRSSLTNVWVFKQDILSTFNNQSQTDVIYRDIEKAFDRINHNFLIHTLKTVKTYGFSKPLTSWFKFFLLGRTQILKLLNINNIFIKKSMLLPLSPILFCLYKNVISSVISYLKILLLANDEKVYKNIYCVDNAFKLQTD